MITISQAMSIFVGGIIVSIIGFLITILMQRTIFKKLDDNDTTMKEMAKEQTAFHVEVLSTYVRKDDHEDHVEKNEDSHRDLWITVREQGKCHGERLAKVEERIDIANEIRNAIEMIKGG